MQANTPARGIIDMPDSDQVETSDEEMCWMNRCDGLLFHSVVDE